MSSETLSNQPSNFESSSSEKKRNNEGNEEIEEAMIVKRGRYIFSDEGQFADEEIDLLEDVQESQRFYLIIKEVPNDKTNYVDVLHYYTLKDCQPMDDITYNSRSSRFYVPFSSMELLEKARNIQPPFGKVHKATTSQEADAEYSLILQPSSAIEMVSDNCLIDCFQELGVEVSSIKDLKCSVSKWKKIFVSTLDHFILLLGKPFIQVTSVGNTITLSNIQYSAWTDDTTVCKLNLQNVKATLGVAALLDCLKNKLHLGVKVLGAGQRKYKDSNKGTTDYCIWVKANATEEVISKMLKVKIGHTLVLVTKASKYKPRKRRNTDTGNIGQINSEASWQTTTSSNTQVSSWGALPVTTNTQNSSWGAPSSTNMQQQENNQSSWN